MLKILIYGNAEERKTLEEALSKSLKENKFSFDIHHLSDSQKFIKNYLFNSNYQLIVAALGDSTKYIIKSCSGMPLPRVITGHISFPPTPEEIDEKLIRNDELASFFSPGEYTVTHRNATRKIPYEDIEYIQSEIGKSVIHLTNGDTETVSKSTNKVLKEINRKYFTRCCLGFAVNTHNVRKIHHSGKNAKVLELKSGAKIILTRTYLDKFAAACSLSFPGGSDLKTLDD